MGDVVSLMAGNVIDLADYKRERQQRARERAVDETIMTCYESMLKAGVLRELSLYPPAYCRSSAILTDDQRQGFAEYIDNQVADEATLRRLRELTRLWGFDTIQRLAEQTVYKGCLRLALFREGGGVIAIWRRCS